MDGSRAAAGLNDPGACAQVEHKDPHGDNNDRTMLESSPHTTWYDRTFVLAVNCPHISPRGQLYTHGDTLGTSSPTAAKCEVGTQYHSSQDSCRMDSERPLKISLKPTPGTAFPQSSPTEPVPKTP